VARGHGFTLTVVLVVGILGASVFWFYGPFLPRLLAPRVAEILRTQPLAVVVSKEGRADLKGAGALVQGARFQVVADGKNLFLADLKEGRMWRYFHHTREGGYSKEDEGFLPLSMFFGGKKYYSAGEVDAPAPKGVEPAPPPGEKKSR
jgi:hypothetical protein